MIEMQFFFGGTKILGPLEVDGTQENRVAHLRTIIWAASGHHSLGACSKSSWCWPQTCPATSVASGEIRPRLGRTLLILSIICLSDATALLDEKSLDQICGI